MKMLLLWTALSTVFCASAMAGSLVVSVLDKEGKPVPDAVVVISPANTLATPKSPLPVQAAIAQEKMQFIPAVTLVGVGSKVSFVNNDSWDHHVRSSPAGMGQFSATHAGFELRLEGKSDGKPPKAVEIRLDKAGVLGSTLLGCYLHGSMRGYIYVSESPWAVKTSAEGLAVFDDLPDGGAQVLVWQGEQLIDLPPQRVTISGAPSKSQFQLTVVPRRRRV